MRSKSAGYILLTTLLMSGALLVLAFAFVELFRAERRLAAHGVSVRIAAAAASAGMDDAIAELKRSRRWTGGFAEVRLPHSRATYTVTFDRAQVSIPYSTNNSSGLLPAIGYGGRVVPPGMVDLIAVGRSGAARRLEGAVVSTTGVILIHSRW